jgi:hypothetical protein
LDICGKVFYAGKVVIRSVQASYEELRAAKLLVYDAKTYQSQSYKL